MLRASLLALLVALALSAPSAAQAATCADYSNQAAAQKAGDTRDADGNGIYCESLPCPCSTSNSSSTPSPSSTPTGLDLGRSLNLSVVTRRRGCHVNGPLPDRGCTPGARFARATTAKICRPGYSARVRNVSQSAKDAVYVAYGMSRHFDGSNGEVDHLVSLELGGSNSRANLFPEAASPLPGAHEKDRLENRLHGQVCAGTLTLRRAQALIARNWVAAYRSRFG